MLRLGARVIRADLRRHPATAVLTGLVVAIAAGALLVTLALRAAIHDPFDQLMRATTGPHAIVTGLPADAARAAALPGVASAGPARTLVEVPARSGRIHGDLVLEALEPRAAIDRPLRTSG